MIVTIVCAGMAGQLGISTEFVDMMPQDDPSVVEFNTIMEEYNAISTLYMVAEDSTYEYQPTIRSPLGRL